MTSSHPQYCTKQLNIFLILKYQQSVKFKVAFLKVVLKEILLRVIISISNGEFNYSLAGAAYPHY